ncbi:methionine--tRNA ligase, cytoplasmic [Lecanosticta acicola]|uniref:methionine--tRNA ligase n=1 Tax=Lecanosticta acicola TaxID=111012 RepID=A0AAI9E8Z6_9PEZI|nr:methionine--tRNA ligase, cytoplasmic [Lecanosticta acicola]
MAANGEEKKVILPEKGKKNILITSALPYVNNVPHLGNIIGSVLSADVFSRYSKARGNPTLFICGTDEYGTATETKAIEEGVTPQQLCDKYNKIHKEVYDWFEIEFDHFGRTPTQQQTDIAQDIFLKLHKNGYLDEETREQPYCPENGHGFLADRFVEGTCPFEDCKYDDARGDQCDKCGKLLDPINLINPRCKLHKDSKLEIRETKHVFLLLDKLDPQVQKWFNKRREEGRWSENGYSITKDWFTRGLKPRGITRDLKWGTPVPLNGYEDKVMYVWFDACIGYVSITATYTEDWEKWWRDPDNVQLYQFMGKDNVPFHTVVFPSSQLGTGDQWTMLDTLSTTEYLNYEHGKFSKSRGIGVFGTSAQDTGVPPDVWRYYLLKVRPETGDTEFEWEAFVAANNNELLNNFGNFVNRVLKFVNSEKTYKSVVPAYPTDIDPEVQKALTEHVAETNAKLKEYLKEMDAVHLKQGLVCAREISSLGNGLLQANKTDNNLFTNERARCDAVVNLAINHIHLLASVIAPYMPATTKSILSQLQAELLIIPDRWEAKSISEDHKIGAAQHLFTKIGKDVKDPQDPKKTVNDKVLEWKLQFGGEELKKAIADKEAKAAANRAAKKAKKEKKAAGNVEAAEKDGAPQDPNAGTAIEEVTEGVRQAALQTS